MNNRWHPPLAAILGAGLVLAIAWGSSQWPGAPRRFTLATFQVDVTIPAGHPCMGGGISPAKQVVDPLLAKGFVLCGMGKPIVMTVCDWCEIRGTSYEKWKAALAEAASTDPARVLVTCTHVHDAPVMDEDAEKILRDMEATGAWKNIPPPLPTAAVQVASVCWPTFDDQCITRVADAVREAVRHPRRITHFRTGKARVERIASNRRFLKPGGTVSYNRMSRCSDPVAVSADEGEIDPWLRTLSFWDGNTPVCALQSYAVHPMSSYGAGKVSWDFVGEAREQMQQAHPGVFQIYGSGCAGNVTAGKYNRGDAPNRALLAGRLKDAMEKAWDQTEVWPLTEATFGITLMPLGARNTPGHTETILRGRVAQGVRPFDRSEAAMGLAWYERVKRGHQIEVPVLDLGPAQLLVLPAEAYVEFQLYAQEMKPGGFVMVLGYGECGPGYIPVERAWREQDSNLNDWAWTPPGSEAVVKKAIQEALGAAH